MDREHKVTITNKELFCATAVNKVLYLSPEAVLLDSEVGKIGIKGSGLFVENIDSKTGVANIKGNIHSVSYYDKNNKNSWLKRLK